MLRNIKNAMVRRARHGNMMCLDGDRVSDGNIELITNEGIRKGDSTQPKEIRL